MTKDAIESLKMSKITDWASCYDDSWQSLIVDEAFAHPAKFAYGLITRIIKHGLAQGYWKAGDVIGDPFAGVGTGGIVCAANRLLWRGVEIEPRFVALARRNFALNPWCRNGEAIILQGDSRNFAAILSECAAVVTSAPFSQQVFGGGKAASARGEPSDYPATNGFTRRGHSVAGYQVQADADGNLAALPTGSVDAILSSPPYAESIQGEHGERETAATSRDARQTAGGSLGQSQRYGGYGITDGNLGSLPSGSVDGVITSAPFENQKPSHAQGSDFGLAHDGGGRFINCEYGKSAGQLGNTAGDTYWKAVAAIYEQCRVALKPSGVFCCVMGNYVKAGKIVDLCSDTWRLLQHIGFEPLERIRALKTVTVEQEGLFGPHRRTKSRVSFFRRLAIQKGSPDPGGEEVLFLRRRA